MKSKMSLYEPAYVERKIYLCMILVTNTGFAGGRSKNMYANMVGWWQGQLRSLSRRYFENYLPTKL